MPPRIPLLASIRRPTALFRGQTASISNTSPSQAIKRDLPTATSQLLDIDSSAAALSRKDATQVAHVMYEQLRSSRERIQSLDDEIRDNNRNDDYARQMTRRWNVGDVYAPHDLSPAEMGKWRRNQARKKDLVDILGLRPLDMYRNFSVISEFMTAHGRIKKGAETGLRPPNQRKMAKAIRRAIGLGIHPSVHRHPELLVRENFRVSAPQSIATVNRDLKF
ncbi:ribosomal protein S18 [Hypoxylon fuscum]|nr:ribosomal protein S18 [Hypoxylon fuscum]